MISSNKALASECWTIFHNPYWYSYIVHILIDEQFHVRGFSALLVPVVSSKMLWRSLHWNVFRMLNEVFFSKFFDCSMFIKSFWRLQHSSKDVALKISAFCSKEKKELVIRQKDEESYRLRKQKSKNGMSGDCRTFQYWKDLRLKYLKERKILQREYEIFKGNCIKLRHGQYHLINEILIAW